MYSDIQNELLGLMAGRLLHEHVLKRIHKSKFFTIMCDETTDVSNIEQAVICIRSVNEKFEIHEDFIGMYRLESTKSDVIFKMLNDVLIRLNLSVSKMRGQSYDGAANMAGCVNGVAPQFQNVEISPLSLMQTEL